MFGRSKNAVDVSTAHDMARNDGYTIVDVRTDAERNGLLVHAVHTFPECSAVVRSQSLFELQ